MPFSPFNSIEIEFFNRIKEDVSVVFDIGLRDDIDYLKNSFDKSRKFHMFEPDPNFVLSCYKQLEELSKTKETSIGSIIRYAVAKYLLSETN